MHPSTSVQRPGDALGLLLNLKKRKLRLRQDDTGCFDCLLFGSFDGIEFRTAERWYDLAPSLQMDEAAADIPEGESRFLEQPFINTFVLKLLFPGCRGELEALGYRYALWEQWGRGQCPDSPLPFFAMVIVNLTAEAIAAYADADRLTKALGERIAPQLKGMDCGMFETLGYHDFVLLLKTDSVEAVQDLCDHIRTLTAGGGDLSAVSTCYTVLGVENWLKSHGSPEPPPAFCAAFDRAGQEIYSVLVELQMAPGEQVGALLDALRGALGADIQEYRTHGTADAALRIPGACLPALLPQYLRGGLLNPANDCYREIALSEYTRFQLRREPLRRASNEGRPSLASAAFDPRYDRIFTAFRALRERHRRSQRLTTSLRLLVSRYLMLTGASHAFELRWFLAPLFQALFENMDRANRLIAEKSRRLEALGAEDACLTPEAAEARALERWNASAEFRVFWEQYETALHCFCEQVGSFLSDISLSDKYFFEEGQLQHASIGSATKLVFFYNQIVHQFLDLTRADPSRGSGYSLLVKSGGQDEIRVTNLFEFLPMLGPCGQRDTSLLLIELPERTLYHFWPALISVTHECVHIFGNRCREERYRFLRQAVLELIAWSLTEKVPEEGDWTALLRELAPAGRPEALALLRAVLRETVATEQKNTRARLIEAAQAQLARREELHTPLDYYSRSAIQSLKNQFYLLLTPTLTTGSDTRFFHNAYDELNRMQREIASALAREAERLELRNPAMLLFSRTINAYDHLSSGPAARSVNQALYRSLWQMLLFLRGTPDLEWVNKQAFVDIAYVADHFIDDCFDAMNEGFSDILAIQMWQLSPAQYIVWHCFNQEGTVEDIFPDDSAVMLRLSCVLRAAYDIQMPEQLCEAQRCGRELCVLGPDLQQDIRRLVDALDAQGAFLRRPDPEALCRHLDRLLIDCHRSYAPLRTQELIVDYLLLCMRENAELERQPAGAAILHELRAQCGDWPELGQRQIHQLILNSWLSIGSARRKREGG